MQTDKLILDNELFFAEVERMLAEEHFVTLRSKGSSMFPFITGGRDSVVLQKSRDINAGDIVLARIPGKGHVLHRVYKADGDRLTLMGDGNLHAKEECTKSDVAGKVTEIIRDGRHVHCSAPAEWRKAAVWMKLLPVRRLLLCVCRIYVKLKQRK